MPEEVSQDFWKEFNFACQSCYLDPKIGVATLAIIRSNLDSVLEVWGTYGKIPMTMREFVNSLGLYGFRSTLGLNAFKVLLQNARFTGQMVKMLNYSGRASFIGAAELGACAASGVLGILVGAFIYATLRTTKIGNDLNNTAYDSFYYWSLGYDGAQASEMEDDLDHKLKIRRIRAMHKVTIPGNLKGMIQRVKAAR